jgi:hypothetical protein
VVPSKNWLVYLTRERNIYGINNATVIDLGRRLRSGESDGPLDDMDLNTSVDDAFGFYSHYKEQVYFAFTTNTSRFNDTIVVCDLKLGEPVPGEALSQFETRVRNLLWKIKTPNDNDWFCHIYQISDDIIALQKSGEVWCFITDNDDLDTLAVEAGWRSPVFIAGAESDSKQWQYLSTRVKPKGSHSLAVRVYLERDDNPVYSFELQQYLANHGIWDELTSVWDTAVWADNQVVLNVKDLDLYSDAIQWKYENLDTDEPFEVSNCNLRYMIGAEER